MGLDKMLMSLGLGSRSLHPEALSPRGSIGGAAQETKFSRQLDISDLGLLPWLLRILFLLESCGGLEFPACPKGHAPTKDMYSGTRFEA